MIHIVYLLKRVREEGESIFPLFFVCLHEVVWQFVGGVMCVECSVFNVHLGVVGFVRGVWLLGGWAGLQAAALPPFCFLHNAFYHSLRPLQKSVS